MAVDLCLTSPPSRAYNHYRPPLGLMYLSSYAEHKGFRTKIVDVKTDPFANAAPGERQRVEAEILSQVVACNPKVVGITCKTPELGEVMAMARKIRAMLPGATLIVGGVHATLQPEDFFTEDSPIDYAVIGEGEETLDELLQALAGGGEVTSIQGLALRDPLSGKMVKTGHRHLLSDLDQLPFASLASLDMHYYTTPNPYAVRGLPLSSFYILTGRGCPSQCTFCVAKHLRLHNPGKAVRWRSARNVVDELEFLVERYGIDGFYVIDDAFTVNMRHAEAVCDEILARRLHLTWACTTRINSISEPLLRKMTKAGCVQVDFGVESGSDRMLKQIQKGITSDQIRQAFAICHKVGMRTFANVLVNLPGETAEDVEQTLRLLDEIKPTVTSMNIFIPYLGTDIYSWENLNLAPAEYEILGRPPREIIQDPRFVFANHSIDLAEFYRVNHRKYNPLWNTFSAPLSTQYLGQLLRSKNKKRYLGQIPDLFRELTKQLHA